MSMNQGQTLKGHINKSELIPWSVYFKPNWRVCGASLQYKQQQSPFSPLDA